MDQAQQILQQCMLFRDIPPDDVRNHILPLGKVRELSKGQHLISLWDQVDFFGVVLSGQIQTQQIYADGSYSISDVIEQGEVVGGDLVGTRSRVAPYYAIAPQGAQLLLLPNDILTQPGIVPEHCRQHIITKLLTLVSQDNIRKEYRLAILAQKGLRERILTYLTMQATKRQTSTFAIPFSREDLASYLCVNRTALSHELSRMRADGIINFRKNEFTLLQWNIPSP